MSTLPLVKAMVEATDPATPLHNVHSASTPAPQAAVTSMMGDKQILSPPSHDREDLTSELPRLSVVTTLKLGRQQAWNDLRSSLPLMLVDTIVVAVSLSLANSLASYFQMSRLINRPEMYFAAIGITLLFQHIHGLYPACGLSYGVEFRRILRTGLMVTTGIGVGLLLKDSPQGFPFLGFLTFGMVLTMLLCAVRSFSRKFLSQFDWWAQPVVIVGNGKTAVDLLHRMDNSRHEGMRPVGLVFDPDSHWDDKNEFSGSTRFLGPVTDLDAILQTTRSCRVAIAEADYWQSQSIHKYHGVPHLMVLTDLGHCPTEKTQLKERNGRIELHCSHTITSPGALFAKRSMDLVLIAMTVLLWLPMMLFIAIAIKLSSPGPIFYRQSRVGRFRKSFQAVKFRSMSCDADRCLKDYLAAHPEKQFEWDATHKLKHDPRVTWIGTFLRKTSLDELPQLWNVLIGDMSLVGPRPIIDCSDYDREYIELHPDVFEMYTMVRPGITGLWQVSGRNLTTYKERVYFDRFYLRNWSFMLDVYILWRTAKTAILQEGAY